MKFKDLCALVESLGYRFDRQAGSHKLYWHPSRRDLPRINLQEGKSGKAKPYQVKQVLKIIDDNGLEVHK